jgi:hypothetical protein
MGLLAALLTTLAGIFVALGFVNILQVYPEGVFSDKFTWPFWMCLAGLFLLGTIACLLVGRKNNSVD